MWFWPTCVALSGLVVVLAGAVVGQARGGTPAPTRPYAHAIVPAASAGPLDREDSAPHPSNPKLEWRYVSIR